ncbi:transglycosylase domain-containing protein [Qipengyuania atrilutea]|uniref:Penicillin-binding protein n=1 Tax=Qipengyuania atrilutea TaxID=2744473 RepID=A0A850H102_9SPHN|nr:transglycosylase domain-containing protein [Actirhodobacter atriluteus]NVD45614.1 penicillin-binding protein [Actirhodobacter atriluteus]
MFGFFKRRRDDAYDDAQTAAREPGYYSLQDPYGNSWDDRLDRFDRLTGYDDGRSPPPFGEDKPRSTRWKWIKRGLIALAILFAALVAWLAVTAPLSKSLEPIEPPQITLLAADGTPIARKGAVVEKPVVVDELPQHVVDAFLSVEDRRFYDHWGIDPRGIARAAWTGYGGGSTITQQLAKFTFLSAERSLSRKAREMLIAFWLEAWLTKDEILSRYLSNAYFGDNMYGLRAASLHYFYRQPENLTLPQAAMLAGLVQAPSRYAPTKHYERAEDRMRTVLSAMVGAGTLTEAQSRAVRSPALDVRLKDKVPTGTYFADWALPQAREMVEGGYESQTLTTTLNSRLQNIARRVVERAPLNGAQVALVAMRRNGEVVAMIGGTDYAETPFNRVTQARRQPGSTFKTFVYLAALNDGMDPDDTISNEAITEGGYTPKNYRDRYSESLTLREAFAQSSNVAAVRLYNQVGSRDVIDLARQFGIEAKMDAGDPSVALGTSAMTLLELTAAYAGIAANDFPVKPHAFATEESGWFGRMVSGQRSLSSSTHQEIEQLLKSAVDSGTARGARLAAPAYGKTGTTQDNRDALFVGYAGDLVVGVWVGNDDNSPLEGVTGGSLPARIWRDFMSQAGVAPVANDRPAPAEQTDPGGPVEPFDVPGLDDIPMGEGGNTRMRVQDGEVVITTEIDGVPVDVRLGDEGLRIGDDGIEAARRRAEERAREAQERAAERFEERQRRFEEAFERELEEAPR